MRYTTPPGLEDLLLTAEGECLTGVTFLRSAEREEALPAEDPVFLPTLRWLDTYFTGKDPGTLPEYRIRNATPFRMTVLDMLRTIPYGETVTYGELAARIARERGMERMSAQAVGGAVGWNPICILIPCHRVVGANGSLTGYGGGIRNKAELLRREGADMSRMFIPEVGTAL